MRRKRKLCWMTRRTKRLKGTPVRRTDPRRASIVDAHGATTMKEPIGNGQSRLQSMGKIRRKAASAGAASGAGAVARGARGRRATARTLDRRESSAEVTAEAITENATDIVETEDAAEALSAESNGNEERRRRRRGRRGGRRNRRERETDADLTERGARTQSGRFFPPVSTLHSRLRPNRIHREMSRSGRS